MHTKKKYIHVYTKTTLSFSPGRSFAFSPGARTRRNGQMVLLSFCEIFPRDVRSLTHAACKYTLRVCISHVVLADYRVKLRRTSDNGCYNTAVPLCGKKYEHAVGGAQCWDRCGTNTFPVRPVDGKMSAVPSHKVLPESAMDTRARREGGKFGKKVNAVENRFYRTINMLQTKI